MCVSHVVDLRSEAGGHAAWTRGRALHTRNLCNSSTEWLMCPLVKRKETLQLQKTFSLHTECISECLLAQGMHCSCHTHALLVLLPTQSRAVCPPQLSSILHAPYSFVSVWKIHRRQQDVPDLKQAWPSGK